MARQFFPTSCALSKDHIEKVDDLVDEDKYETRNHFIKLAIKEKLEREGVL